MSTQFAFRADAVNFLLPTQENSVSNGSSFVSITPPDVDPISDAINNVRFACTGFAPLGGAEHVIFGIKTTHTFRFQPQATGRLTTHAHFMPQGAFSLAARKPSWFWDWPGDALFNMYIRMRVRVTSANGVEIINTGTKYQRIFGGHAAATSSYSASSEGVIDAQFMDFHHTRSFRTIVVPSDTVEIRAQYLAQAWAFRGAEFFVDFASIPASRNGAGDGLNSPLAVINIAE